MKILVAASGASDEVDPSVLEASAFPWPKGSEIHVLSVAEVVQPIMIGMVPDVIDAGAVQVTTEAEALSTASAVAQHFRDLGFTAVGLSADGDPEMAILEHAKKWGADLIVVGSHNRSSVEKFLTGSISESVVKHAPCSVLVLKHGVMS